MGQALHDARRQIVVTMGQRRIEGFAQALDSDGALLLRRDSGQVERILSATWWWSAHEEGTSFLLVNSNNTNTSFALANARASCVSSGTNRVSPRDSVRRHRDYRESFWLRLCRR